jgi:hypothetical protein
MTISEKIELDGEAYCPHCYLLVESGVSGPWPVAPARCPHCRLMIGPGRARPTADGIPGARGAAAGVMAERARHVTAEPEHTEDEIRAGIRLVARDTSVPPERLLMVDYQQYAIRDRSLPQLHEILGTFGSWKRARREAVEATLDAA